MNSIYCSIYHNFPVSPVFPEELWGLILDKLDNFDDVERLLNSIPNLGQKFNRVKIRNYFGKILPILVKQCIFDGKGILKFRVVCKSWQGETDRFLETLEPPRQFYTNVLSEVLYVSGIDVENGLANRPVICLESAAQIRSLKKTIRNHPRNPFVGRAVSFLIRPGLYNDDAEELERNSVEYIRAACGFLKLFGHHIRFAVLDFGSLYEGEDSMTAIRTYKRVTNCIGYLSCAVSIKMNLNLDLSEESIYLSWFVGLLKEQLPPKRLTNLKSFELFGYGISPGAGTQNLLRCIFGQGDLTSFGLPLHLWQCEYTSMLENITELVIDAEWSSSYKKLPKLLSSLRNNLLTTIKLLPCRAKRQTLDLSNLLKQLKPVSVKKLEIMNYAKSMNLIAPGIAKPIKFANHSIQQVSIFDSSGIYYDFLYLLPNLKNLRIYANKVLQIANSSNSKISNNITEVIRHYIYSGKVGRSFSIWNMLPNLSSLTVTSSDGQLKRFSKECMNKCFVNRM